MSFGAEITNNVKKFGPSARRNAPDIMYRGVMKAGGIVKTDAAARVRFAKFSQSIKVVGKRTKDTGPEARVGYKRGSKGWYGKFFESGTKRHTIEPKNGKVLAWNPGQKDQFKTTRMDGVSIRYRVASSKAIFRQRVNHPGMKAQPALKTAYEAKLPDIKQAIADAAIQILKKGISDAQ